MSSGQPPSHSPMGHPVETKITRGHSCVLCRRRKIKCDGQHPCNNCQRSRAACVQQDIAPRKRKRTQLDLVARLRRAEEALSKAGLKVEDNDEYDNVEVDAQGASDAAHSTEVEKQRRALDFDRHAKDGKLIVEKGQSRYIEDSIWGNISTEVREDTVHLLQQSSEDEDSEDNLRPSDHASLLFGRLCISDSLRSTHPPPVQIFKLWQIFLNNVNPLTKIIHAPIVQEILLQAMGDLNSVSPDTEALMFAIYHAAIISIDDKTCQNIMGTAKVTALAKHSTATQQALINAKVLRTSSLTVLQALTLYLLAIRQTTDHDTLWVLAGVATKIGQRMGLHREPASASFSVIETEIRRRLWWQILTIEGHSSFFSGSATSAVTSYHRPSRFLNVNDSDLSVSMKEPPAELAPITEMLFCCINYELGKFVYLHFVDNHNATKIPHDRAEQVKNRLEAVDELERFLEQKFLRFCDPSVPLHYLVTLMVPSALSKMRLRIYAPHQTAKVVTLSQDERDAAFAISVKVLEMDNEFHSTDARSKLERFMWHIRQFFQLEAFIFALSELRVRTFGRQVDLAWKLVEAVYLHHEHWLHDVKNKLWFAVGNLCLKAWEQRAKSLQKHHGMVQLRTPAYVRELCAQRGKNDVLLDTDSNHDTATMDFSNNMEVMTMQNEALRDDQWANMNVTLTTMPFDLDMGGMNWEYWQTLSDDCATPSFT